MNAVYRELNLVLTYPNIASKQETMDGGKPTREWKFTNKELRMCEKKNTYTSIEMAGEYRQTMSYVKNEGLSFFKGQPNTKTIPECLKYFAKTKGDEEAFVFINKFDRVSVTWDNLLIQTINVAKSMVKLGVRKGDNVVVHLKEGPEWLYMVYGAMMAGACPVPLYYNDKSWDHVTNALERLDRCSMLIVDDRNGSESVEKVLGHVDRHGCPKCRKYPFLKQLICIQLEEVGNGESSQNLDKEYFLGNWKQSSNLSDNGNVGNRNPSQNSQDVGHSGIGVSLQTLLLDSEPDVELPLVVEDDVSVCFLSSGSTGTPKYVARTNKQYILNCRANFEEYRVHLHENCIEFRERAFASAGGFPQTVVLGHCRVTSTFEPSTQYEMERLINAIKQEGCEMHDLSYSLLTKLVSIEIPANWPVKVVLYSGQRVSKQMISTIRSLAPVIYRRYGTSESSMISCSVMTEKEIDKSHCVGRVMRYKPIEVKIVDNNSCVVPLGVHGEIYVRTATSMQCYLGDPSGSREIIDEDGWCRIGDIGMMLESNGDIELYVLGRKSDIIRFGENEYVTLGLIEMAIEEMHLDIEQAFVISISDCEMSPILCAFVVLKRESRVDETFMKEQFKRLQDERPIKFKIVPQHWFVIDKIPVLNNGKPSRRQLKDLVGNFLKAESYNIE